MAKSRQIRLPGLEADPPAKSPVPRSPPVSAFGDTPSTTGLGVDATEVPAEPVEAKPTTPDLTGKTVYVIDSHSLIFQVFHALPEMTSPRGEPIGAVFGFARDMMYLLDEKKPDYLFVAFDLAGPTFRHELFTAYKEHRGEDAQRTVCRNFRTFAGCWRRWAFRCWSARGSRPTTFWPRSPAWWNKLGGECCWSPATRTAGN